jgi:hypothetical protein
MSEKGGNWVEVWESESHLHPSLAVAVGVAVASGAVFRKVTRVAILGRKACRRKGFGYGLI